MGWVFRKIVFVANFDNIFRVHLGNYSILGNESKQLYQNFICLLLLVFVPTVFKYTWKQNEGISDSCYMDEPWKRSAKWNKPDTEEHNSMCLSRIDEFTQPESIVEVASMQRRGWTVSYCLMHTEFWLGRQEISEVDSGDDCTALWMELMLLHCTRKMVTTAYFMVYLLQ